MPTRLARGPIVIGNNSRAPPPTSATRVALPSGVASVSTNSIVLTMKKPTSSSNAVPGTAPHSRVARANALP